MNKDDTKICENARSSKKRGRAGKAWSPEEDEQVRNLVQEYGKKSWAEFAKFMPKFDGGEIAKRWHRHLDVNINQVSWTSFEVNKAIRLLYTIHSKHKCPILT